MPGCWQERSQLNLIKIHRRRRRKLAKLVAQFLKYGFSLIELLIVVTILGLLATVIIVTVNPAKRLKDARDSSRKTDIGQIANALAGYLVNAGVYPGPTGCGTSSGLTALTASQDLKLIPKGPTGEDYCLYLNLGRTEVAVYATLEDPTSGVGAWVWCWRSDAGRAAEVAGGNCLVN